MTSDMVVTHLLITGARIQANHHFHRRLPNLLTPLLWNPSLCE